MLDGAGGVLYVGKARALRNRVGSYFNATPKPTRIMAMLAQVARIEVTVTRSEADALLLENQLIKSLQPRYNVMLRDDKSYPFVLLTKEEWPRIAFHRGPRAIAGRYFGPYPSAVSVRETLNLMHKLFRLRSCEDSVFRNRAGPACSTRSAAAARPAWAWWRPTTMRTRCAAPACSWTAAAANSATNWPRRCRPPAMPSTSSRPPACAT